MEGPPLGPAGEDITWPDQVAPRGRKASSTRKIKPQTSNLLKHQKFANKGKDKYRRPHILTWYVKYKGYDKPEWHDASEFLHDINQDWLQSNIKHKIDVGIQDVCVLRSKYVVHPRFLDWKLRFGDSSPVFDHRDTVQLCRLYYRL